MHCIKVVVFECPWFQGDELGLMTRSPFVAACHPHHAGGSFVSNLGVDRWRTWVRIYPSWVSGNSCNFREIQVHEVCKFNQEKNRSISLCNHHDTALMEMWYFYISTWHQRLPFPDTLVACLEIPWFKDVLSQNLCMITYDYMPMGLHILSVWSWAARECNYTKMQCMCW